jgi:hypothetical protein
MCAGFAVPSSGSASGGNGETVGTLPNTSSSGVGLNISRVSRDARPALYLEGKLEDIYGTVLELDGRAVITLEVLDASTHVVRLTFHGDLRLDLDREVFEQSSVGIGWSVPQAFGPAHLTLSLGDRTIASGLVSARSLALPILALESSGGLETAPLSISASGRHGTHAGLEVSTAGQHLILDQNR